MLKCSFKFIRSRSHLHFRLVSGSFSVIAKTENQTSQKMGLSHLVDSGGAAGRPGEVMPINKCTVFHDSVLCFSLKLLKITPHSLINNR